MARRNDRDWVLGMAEIRALMPHWPEQMVQDYFARGREDRTFSLKHEFMGPENTDTCQGVDPDDGDVPIFDAETGLWCPGSIASIDPDPDGDCYCFFVEPCEASCTALDEFIQNNGTGASSFYLSRNYTTDITATTGLSGVVASVLQPNGVPVGPDGVLDRIGTNTSPENIGLDTCGEDLFLFSGDPTTPDSLQVSNVGNVNDMSMSMLMITDRSPANDFPGIFIGRPDISGGGSQISGYTIGWNTEAGKFVVYTGSTPPSSSNEDNGQTIFDGPVGFDENNEPIWVALSMRFTRTSSALTVYASWVSEIETGSSVGTITTLRDGSSLSGASWWTLDGGEVNDFVWGGKNYTFGGTFEGTPLGSKTFRGVHLFTALHSTQPSIEYLTNLYYALQRNSTELDCDAIENIPVPGGAAPVFDASQGLWVLRSPLPVTTETPKYLVSDPGSDLGAKWDDLPIIGGTTGQRLEKLSDDLYDVGWVQRDAKTFESAADPTTTETVLAGDFWVQGGIG